MHVGSTGGAWAFRVLRAHSPSVRSARHENNESRAAGLPSRYRGRRSSSRGNRSNSLRVTRAVGTGAARADTLFAAQGNGNALQHIVRDRGVKAPARAAPGGEPAPVLAAAKRAARGIDRLHQSCPRVSRSRTRRAASTMLRSAGSTSGQLRVFKPQSGLTHSFRFGTTRKARSSSSTTSVAACLSIRNARLGTALGPQPARKLGSANPGDAGRAFPHAARGGGAGAHD